MASPATSGFSGEPLGSQGGKVARSRLACGPWLGLAATVFGGALAWLVLEWVHPVFTPPEKYAFLPTPVPPELSEELEELSWRLHLGNAVVVLAILGAFLGGFLGLGEGVAQRSPRSAVLGLGGGAAITAMFGASAGVVGHFIFQWEYYTGKETLLAWTIAMQAAVLATLGLGAGLAVGVLLGRRRLLVASCSIAGILAGVLAGLLFPYLASRYLPVAASEIVVPEAGPARLLWIGLTAGLLGLIVPGMTFSRSAAKG